MKKIGFAIVLELFAILFAIFGFGAGSALGYYGSLIIAIIGIIMALSGLCGDDK